MNISRRVTSTVLVVVIAAFGLSACGSDDDGGDGDKQETTSQNADQDTGSDATENNNNGDKPSKDDVIDGFKGIAADALGGEIPEAIRDDVVECAVNELYDDASAQTLTALAEGKFWQIDQNDIALFGKASSTCQS